MMHVINYRLHRPGMKYDDLYEAIQKLSGTYWHNTTSSWLVETSLTPKAVYNILREYLDSNDELAVFRLEGAYYGTLRPDDHKWIQARSGMYQSS